MNSSEIRATAIAVGALVLALFLLVGGLVGLGPLDYLHLPATFAVIVPIGAVLIWSYRERDFGRLNVTKIVLWTGLGLAVLGTVLRFTVVSRPSVAYAQGDTRIATFTVEGMVTPNCPVLVKVAVGKMSGVVRVSASYEDRTAEVEYLPGKVTPEEILAVIEDQVGDATMAEDH